MANFSYSIRAAIYDALSGSTDLAALVGANIFQSSAPSGTGEPYVIISTVSMNRQGRTKDGDDMIDAAVRIYGYSLDTNPTEIENISQAIHDALDRQTLTINDFVFVGCHIDGLDETDLIDGSRHRCVKDFVVKASI